MAHISVLRRYSAIPEPGLVTLCRLFRGNPWRPTLLSVVWSSVVMCLVGLCGIPPLQAQTPEDAFRRAIYGPNFDGDATTSICGRLNQITGNRSSGTDDLIERCNGLAGTQPPLALRQVAAEEVATLGTNAVKASTTNIGARLAALRAGATGIIRRGQGVDLERYQLPGTLVASLDQYAAVGSPGPAQTATPFNRFGLFVNGTLSVGDKDATSNEDGFDFNTYGVTAGIDYRVTNSFVLGVAFSYQATDADLDPTFTEGFTDPVDAGSVESRSYTGSIYGTYYVSNNFYVDGIVSFGWSDYDIDRSIIYAVDTLVNQTASASTDGTQFSFSLGAGYDFTAGGWTFGPFVRVNYLRFDIDGYQEEIGNTNDGFGWALEIDSQEGESFTSVLGGQVSYAINTGLGVLLPQVRFEWEHQFEDDRRTITARFIHDPERAPISFSTDTPDRDFFNLGVGLSATFRGGVSAFAYYETVLGLDDLTRHAAVFGIRKEL